MISIIGSPPSMDDVRHEFSQIGIEINSMMFKNMNKGAGFLIRKYRDRPEFEKNFFQIV